jgi:Lrp/AsnC family transcriptional regulator, leucine-responsive regulatory protein
MLNKKETQILKELDKNSRQSNSQIAKKVGMNKETVNYTIRKLEDQNIIRGYFSLVNYFKLGSNIFKLLIRFKDIGEKGEKKIIDWLIKKESVIWVGVIDGKWDIIIALRNNNLEKIYGILEDFNNLFSKNIQEKQLLIAYEMEWLNEKYLYLDKRENYNVNLNQRDKKETLDKIDLKIIYELELNARASLIKISSKIKLTAESIAKRIKNLVKKKIIAGFKIRLNAEKLGNKYAHLFVSLRDFSKIDEITAYYENLENCVFIMKYHGNYDLHLELIANSNKDFRKIISDFREKFGNSVSDYHLLTILEEFKLS